MSSTPYFDALPQPTPMVDFAQLQYLQDRVESLETQLQNALAHSRKKEAYAHTLEVDLEHIIQQLKRLEVVR